MFDYAKQFHMGYFQSREGIYTYVCLSVLFYLLTSVKVGTNSLPAHDRNAATIPILLAESRASLSSLLKKH